MPASKFSLRNWLSIDVRIERSTSGVNQPACAPARSGTMMSRRSSRATKIEDAVDVLLRERSRSGALQRRAAERRRRDDDDLLARLCVEARRFAR